MNARGTSVLGPCIVWCLAAAPFVFDVQSWGGASRTALVLVPWIAWCGLPRARAGELRTAVALEAALILPALALGAWIDRARGAEPGEVVRVAGFGFFFAVALAAAARLAARTTTTRGVYATLWFTFVAGVPILTATLVLGGDAGFGAAPAWLARTASASPLSWIVAQLPSGTTAWPWLPLVATVVLLALAATKRGDPDSVSTDDWPTADDSNTTNDLRSAEDAP